jgi:hypothetical protein
VVEAVAGARLGQLEREQHLSEPLDLLGRRHVLAVDADLTVGLFTRALGVVSPYVSLEV